MATLPNHL